MRLMTTNRPTRPWWRDLRVWLGIAITAVTLALALRDVSFVVLARDLARANLPIVIGLSVPAYIVTIYVRALRWGHLTDPVCPIRRGALFRASAVGFMANNLFPLRIGEVVRAWYLARESGARTSAVFGTVILDRVLDSVVLVGLALAVLGVRGAQSPEGPSLAVGLPLLAAAGVPVVAVVLLRLAPERTIALVSRPLGFRLPNRLRRSLEDLLRRIAEGFASLQGGRHLIWIALHSAVIWLVLGVVPFVAAILALGVDLGSPGRMLGAAYATLAAVGVAVAIPSVPGFFGPYHLACRLALSRFGVPEELALAVGTLAHAIFWVTSTGLGLGVLRLRPTRLKELAEAGSPPGKDPPAARR